MRVLTLSRSVAIIVVSLALMGCASIQSTDEPLSSASSPDQTGESEFRIQVADLSEDTETLLKGVARGKVWVFRAQGPPRSEGQVNVGLGYYNHRGHSKVGSILQTIRLGDEGWKYLVVELYFDYDQGRNNAILRIHQRDPGGSGSSTYQRIEVQERTHSRSGFHPFSHIGFPTNVPVLIGVVGFGDSGHYNAVEVPELFPEGILTQDLNTMSQSRIGVIGVYLEKRSN